MIKKLKKKISLFFNSIINTFRDKFYKPLLSLFLKRIYLGYLFFIGLFIVFVFLSGVKFTFFPSVELDDLYVEFKIKPGSTIEKTKIYGDELLSIVNKVNNELEDSLNSTVIRSKELKLGPKSHTGQIQLFLEAPEKRGIKAYDIVEKLRSNLNDFDGLENLIIGVGDPFGKPLSFALLSNNSDDLEKASLLFSKKLKEIEGVAAASTNYEFGPDEINFTLNEKAKSLGLTNFQILYQVRQGFFGTQVQDLQKNKDELKLWIRFNEDEKNSFSSLENMKIKTEKGIFPLSELVKFQIDNKIVSINRKNGSKIIEIEGELASNTSYSSDIISEVENKMFPEIQKKYPSVRMELSGSSDEGTVTANSMKKIMPVFALLILCIVLVTLDLKLKLFLFSC